jgi:alpha-tubulin suppressor-like RCC1 family protein
MAIASAGRRCRTVVAGSAAALVALGVGGASVAAAASSSYTLVDAFGTGLLGNGTTGTSSTPVKIDGLSNHFVTQVSSYSEYGAPGDHTLALTSGGSIYSWGSNDHGQLGNGTEIDSLAPTQPLPLPAAVAGRVVAVSAGYQFSLALTSTGQVLSWGASGELGDGSVTDRLEPAVIPAPGGQRALAISAGESHAEVVTSNGQVWGWGSNADGELGNGSFANSLLPVQAELPTGFVATAVAAAGVHYAAEDQPQSHTLALGADGRLFGWGNNSEGQLGTGQPGADQPLPVQSLVPRHTTVVAIAAGGENSGALTSTGEVLTWGLNAYGTLCNGTEFHDAHPLPADLLAGTVATGLSMSYSTTLVATSAGQLLGCGDNATFDKGALGADAGRQTSQPIAIVLPAGTLSGVDAGGPTSYVVVQRN